MTSLGTPPLGSDSSGTDLSGSGLDPDAAPGASPQREENSERVVVGVERSVRFGRVLVGGAALGAILAALACLFFPVREDLAFVDYTMAQIVGFMAVMGAGIGLLAGALLALLLGLAARSRRGAAVATHTDVR